MIKLFDKDGVTANGVTPPQQTEIAIRWQKLLDKEKALRAYMRTHEAEEPFIGQYTSQAWITPHNIEEFLGFFLKQLAQADESIFVLHYDGGYVGFSGHNAVTILTMFDKIEQEMYANCMRTLIEKNK